MFALPERRFGLEPVHQIIDRIESGAAMLRGGGDEDDRITGSKRAKAMDDRQAEEGEAGSSVLGDGFDGR